MDPLRNAKRRASAKSPGSRRGLCQTSLFLSRSGGSRSVAGSKQVRIYVVEALLIAIYLPEGNGVYIHIRPTLLPEATTFNCLYTAESPATPCIARTCTSWRVATETQPTRNTI